MEKYLRFNICKNLSENKSQSLKEIKKKFISHIYRDLKIGKNKIVQEGNVEEEKK